MPRIEHDAFGPIEVPSERLWGAQTERSRRHFAISTEKMPREVIMALVRIKQAAAETHAELGTMASDVAEAIRSSAEEILEGLHDQEFPLSVWQTGSGTQTNMNVNEVLANRASELLGGARGEGRKVHPNDDVNRGQSSNDVFPTAMNIAAVEALSSNVLPALTGLHTALLEKALAFVDIVKIGRTHLQDATPLTLGQEFSGYAAQLGHARDHIERAFSHLYELALGGTAVGTGLHAPRDFPERTIARLAHKSGLPFVPAANKFEALAAHDAIVHAHAALRGLAVSLLKIGGDIRLLASGPRAGIGELVLPENEPGSSIMPGKVNPTQVEALSMVSMQVMGNDVTIGLAGASGHLELNACKPVIIHAFLQSCHLLADGMRSFTVHCVAGIVPNRVQIARHLEESLMLVTALSPHIGYDAAARIAKKAHQEGLTLKAAATSLGLVTPAQFDQWVRPETMLGTP